MKMIPLLFILYMKLNYFCLVKRYRKIKFNGHFSTRSIKIKLNGKNNEIIAGKHVVLENCRFNLQGDNHKLVFGDNINISGVTFNFEKKGSAILIGSGTWIGPGCILTAMDGTTLNIGHSTLLAPSCHIRTSDSHYVYQNGEEINKPKDILIGNHCWLGDEVFVLKGSRIADGCIVGARSVVTSSCVNEPNCILGGTPAKILKKNISWKL